MLGEGVYTLTEVARLIAAPPATVRAWFKGRPDRQAAPLFRGEYEPRHGDYAVSFLDLIDTLVASRFRAEGVAMPVVRRSFERMKQDLGTPHPFSHELLYTDGQRVIRHATDEPTDPVMLDVISNQQHFEQMVSPLSDVNYSAKTRLAEQWRIGDGVLVNPNISFGKPVLEGTGACTYVIYHQFLANDSNASLVADLFELSESQVLQAVRFEQDKQTRRAA